MLLLDKQPTGNALGVATRSWGLDADASPTQQAGFPIWSPGKPNLPTCNEISVPATKKLKYHTKSYVLRPGEQTTCNGTLDIAKHLLSLIA